MFNKKIIAFVAVGALAACLALVGCGGQAASSSAASTSESGAAATSASADSTASTNAAASSENAAASSAAASESAAASSAPAASSTPAASTDSYIGDQKAIEIALGDAGFAQSDVTELEVELDLDDAVPNYDVSFKNGGLEYDYEIDAVSSAILMSKSEPDD